MHDFMTSFDGGAGLWALEDANDIARWDNRITVIDQFPLYKNISRDLLSADMQRLMDYND